MDEGMCTEQKKGKIHIKINLHQLYRGQTFIVANWPTATLFSLGLVNSITVGVFAEIEHSKSKIFEIHVYRLYVFCYRQRSTKTIYKTVEKVT